MMLKNLRYILLIALLSSCSSTGSYNYIFGKDSIKRGVDKYYIHSVQVDMPNSSAMDGYPSSTELASILSSSIQNSLCEDNICASRNDKNKLDVSLQFDYKRRFAWGGSAYSSMHVSHFIEINKENKLLATQRASDYGIQRGAFSSTISNLRKVLTLSNAKDERVELEILANSIARDLKKAGKK